MRCQIYLSACRFLMKICTFPQPILLKIAKKGIRAYPCGPGYPLQVLIPLRYIAGFTLLSLTRGIKPGTKSNGIFRAQILYKFLCLYSATLCDYIYAIEGTPIISINRHLGTFHILLLYKRTLQYRIIHKHTHDIQT